MTCPRGGIQLLAGPEFTARDIAGSTKVAVVDESLVRKLMKGADPIGRRIAFEFGGGHGPHMEPVWREIVGVVRHVRHDESRVSRRSCSEESIDV